jgi:methylphosphotriester-DNA--protein-cysteine methyltransferase
MPLHVTSPLTTAAGLSLDAVACYRVPQARDARFDRYFFAGVPSTGIYCRPVWSWAARLGISDA